jgi:hypothetical protein
MFNGIFNLNFIIQNSQIYNDLFIYHINQLQKFLSYSSINYIPKIEKEGKINLRDNNYIRNDDSFVLKEYNNYNMSDIYKEENLPINVDNKNGPVDTLEQLKSKYLNKKDFSEINLGKKRKNINSKKNHRKHTKFSEDNLQRKCITIIINNTLEFINKKIKKIYNGNIGNGMNSKKLVSIQLKPNSFTIDFIKKLLHKTLGEIFSDNISLKYTNYFPNYNALMIKNLLDEKDQDKRKYLEKLFGITFIQCVKKFVGIYNSEELDGFITFNEYKEKLNQDPEYLKALKDYLINFEENIRRKKPKDKSKK